MKLTFEQEEEIISFTRELIRLPGCSGDERKTAECVEKKMRALGYDEVITDNFGNVLGIINGAKPGPTIIFDGHMDVVSVSDPKLWKHDPYGGERDNGKIHGLGSVDMKGALAAMICAPAYINKNNFTGRVLVSASVAEEVLIGFAFNKILEKYSVDAVIIGEPTGLKVGIAEKGRAGIEMISYGTVAHSSRPDLGDNAVYSMMEAVERIRAIPCREHSFLGKEVIELVEINSSPSPGNGSIPDKCRTFWECRLLDGETKDSFLERWQKALEGLDNVELKIAQNSLNSYSGVNMEMEDFQSGWISQSDWKLSSLVGKSVNQCLCEVEHYAVPYGCNALVSGGTRNIQTVVLGPGSISLAHKPNEFIEIKELLKGAQIYGTIVENLELLT